jgi:hypothetical protein
MCWRGRQGDLAATGLLTTLTDAEARPGFSTCVCGCLRLYVCVRGKDALLSTPSFANNTALYTHLVRRRPELCSRHVSQCRVSCVSWRQRRLKPSHAPFTLLEVEAPHQGFQNVKKPVMAINPVRGIGLVEQIRTLTVCLRGCENERKNLRELHLYKLRC